MFQLTFSFEAVTCWNQWLAGTQKTRNKWRPWSCCLEVAAISTTHWIACSCSLIIIIIIINIIWKSCLSNTNKLCRSTKFQMRGPRPPSPIIISWKSTQVFALKICPWSWNMNKLCRSTAFQMRGPHLPNHHQLKVNPHRYTKNMLLKHKLKLCRSMRFKMCQLVPPQKKTPPLLSPSPKWIVPCKERVLILPGLMLSQNYQAEKKKKKKLLKTPELGLSLVWLWACVRT